MKIGLARVSTCRQETQDQHRRLLEAGCDRVFEEKASGTLSINKRTVLQDALSHLRKGDVFVATKIDRIAR